MESTDNPGDDQAVERTIASLWRILYASLLLVCLSHASADEEARLIKIYDADGISIDAGFIPDKPEIILGEPLFMTFSVANRSEKPYRFFVGGDNRGSVRHNNFRITAVDARDKAVKDPYSYNHFGGFGKNITLGQGQTYTERLYLGYWCAFEEPGVYTVTCERKLNDHGPEPRHPIVRVITNFKLTIVPFNHGKMKNIIADLGERICEGQVEALFEATLGLASINDERIIPYLAVSLNKGNYHHYQHKRHAIRGLSQFSSDAAADALATALKDPDYSLRGAAGDALQKMKKLDRALEPLLKELADESESIRALAARALGATKAKRALGPLIEAMNDRKPTVRHTAAIALGFLGFMEAIPPLRERLEDNDMAMRVAAAKGLRRLGVPLRNEWLTPVIRAATNLNDQSFHEAIRLIRLYGGENAPRALASCLQFDDPSPRNGYNMFLILAIESCRVGPKYYYKYHHDLNADGTPKQIEENRKILDALKTWLDESR